MSKTLVTYVSQTGNTKSIAEAIYTAIEGEKSIKSAEDVLDEDLKEYSLIFIGFPVHSPIGYRHFLHNNSYLPSIAAWISATVKQKWWIPSP